MDDLRWLENWYRRQCNGTWEGEFGVKIDTLDNPGWAVDIDLSGTPLEGRPFPRLEEDKGDGDWIFAWVEGNHFNGCGDPRKLGRIIGIFRTWVQASGDDVTMVG